MPSLNVVDSNGDYSTFSRDRFVGTMVQVGIPKEKAIVISTAVTDWFDTSEEASISTDTLRRIVLEAGTSENPELAVFKILQGNEIIPEETIELPDDTMLNLNGSESSEEDSAPPISLRGPCGLGIKTLELVYDQMAAVDSLFAAHEFAQANLACAAVEYVLPNYLPLFVSSIADILGIDQDGIERIIKKLLGDLPTIPRLAGAAEEAIKKYKEWAGTDNITTTELLDEASKKKYIEIFPQIFNGPDGGSDLDLTVPDDKDYIAVGSTERRNKLYNPHNTGDSGSALYCYAPTDKFKFFDTIGYDEPQAVEANYCGNTVFALEAPEDSVDEKQDVDTTWMTDVDHDIPMKQEGYWDVIPIGKHFYTYSWLLLDPDDISSSKLIKKGIEKLEETLDSKKKEIAEKAKKAIDDAVKGSNYPGAGLAGMLAEQLVKLLIPWLIDMLSDNKFTPLTICHCTIRPSKKSKPLSIVTFAAHKSIKGLAKIKDKTKETWEFSTKEPSQINSYYRAWWGESSDPGKMPRGLKTQIAKAKNSSLAVVWRQKPEQGFGIAVKQEEPNDAFWTHKGVYVAALRADVREIKTNDTDFFN